MAKSLGIAMESLRRWQQQADAACAVDPGEFEELRKLRRANEILSSASAFFAARLDPTRH